MSIYHLPSVSAHNYPTLLKLMGNQIPATHEEWVQFLAKRRLEEGRDYGHIVLDVDVNPHEFGRYCRFTGQNCDFAALSRFILEKAGGNGY